MTLVQPALRHLDNNKEAVISNNTGKTKTWLSCLKILGTEINQVHSLYIVVPGTHAEKKTVNNFTSTVLKPPLP